MGRPRKPREIKILSGTFRKDRDKKISSSVQQLLDIPTVPRYLGKYAREFWKKLSALLISSKILSELDLTVLELACIDYQLYRQTMGIINKQGLKKYLKGRNTQNSLELTTLKSAMNSLNKRLSSFGLTPSDRAKLGISPKPPAPETAEEKQERENDLLMEKLLSGN